MLLMYLSRMSLVAAMRMMQPLTVILCLRNMFLMYLRRMSLVTAMRMMQPLTVTLAMCSRGNPAHQSYRLKGQCHE